MTLTTNVQRGVITFRSTTHHVRAGFNVQPSIAAYCVTYVVPESATACGVLCSDISK